MKTVQKTRKSFGNETVIPQRKLRMELDKAFVPELDSRIGKGCNLGNVVVGLMNREYSRGSPFDKAFVHEDSCSQKESEKILHAAVSKKGLVEYESLICSSAGFYALDSLDEIAAGARIRRQIERIIIYMNSIISEKTGNGFWGARLVASSQRNGHSLLVLGLRCKQVLLDGPKDDSNEIFVVVPTSSRMELDAFTVANHMIANESYLEDRVFYMGKGSGKKYVVEKAD